jgi:hypothetical protein
MHFDGQPVIPAQWSQPSPWQSVLKRRGSDGQWQQFDRNALFGASIDSEWRLFARSASDDKGPIMMFLTAFDILQLAGAGPVFNVKVLLDSDDHLIDADEERSAGRHAFNQIADIEEQGQTQAEKYERPPNSGAKALNEHSNPNDKRRIEPKNSPWKCHARAPPCIATAIRSPRRRVAGSIAAQ